MPILFIDEIHSTVGAGATTGGTMDLATLIKPILTTGQLRMVGSTTHEDYKHIEKDRALARRLQKVTIDEPTIQETVRILQGLRSRYEGHHRVRYSDDSLEAAAKLASRHLRDYRLPDSAIDVLDEAGAKTRLAAPPTPKGEAPAILDVGVPQIEEVVARMARIPAKQASSSDRDRLRTPRGVARARRVRAGRGGQAGRARNQALARRARAARSPGRRLPLHRPHGRRQDRARQAARAAPRQRVRALRHERVHGEARRRPADRRASGYVGFEQGGLLVDAVRTHPYSVVLLDEIEKAHPDIFNILLQVMDHATLTDNNGRKADFRQVVLIMTSNAGSREMSAGSIGFTDSPTSGSLDNRQRAAQARSKSAVERVFSPEFRNRLDAIVNFKPLTADVMETIVDKFIIQLEEQLAERRIAITLLPDARHYLAKKGYDAVFGARPLARVIQAEVRDRLTDEILFGALENGGNVTIGFDGKELTFDFRREPMADNTTISRQGGGSPLVGPGRRRRSAARPTRRRNRPTSRSSSARSADAEKQAQEYLCEVPPGGAGVRRRRGRACARSWRRTPSAPGATCWSACSRSSTTSIARSTPRRRPWRQTAATGDPLLQGVEMVQQQFLAKMDGFGVKRIDALGAEFDPLLHEAVTAVPAPDASADGRVVGVITHGYRIGDEVLRPALVAVGKAAQPIDHA